jgi:hypothetical protein
VGTHSKSKHRKAAAIIAGDPQPWTRRYPAITLAALAGTVVGAPGGVAAAMVVHGPSGAASSSSIATIVAASSTSTVRQAAAMSFAPRTVAKAIPAAAARTSALAPVVVKAVVKKVPPNPYASTTLAALEPVETYGTQEYFSATNSQWANARAIVQVAEERKMPLYAAVIAIATAIQESRLQNLTAATNADSLGLFQQRPSQGWGTAAQITDPYYASNAFLAALNTYAPYYMGEDLWESAQAVQRSGYPTAYAQWQAQAAHMVYAIVNDTAA